MSQQPPVEYCQDPEGRGSVIPADDQYYSSEMYADKYNSPYGSTTQPLNSQAPPRAPSQATSRAPSQAPSRAPSHAASRAPSRGPSQAPSHAQSRAQSAMSQPYTDEQQRNRPPPSSGYQPKPAPRSISASNDDVFSDSKQKY